MNGFARQIKFQVDREMNDMFDDSVHHGILIPTKSENVGRVVCGCCGAIFSLYEVKVLERYENWVDFEEEIAD